MGAVVARCARARPHRADRFARLPIALQISLEIWAFSGAALVAGQLGAVPLAAHTVTLNMAALAFMLPLGIAQGAATRVGNLIGAREPDAAQRAAWVVDRAWARR